MKKRAALLMLALVLALGAGLAIRNYSVGTVRVAGVSMQDTLLNGDLTLVTRFDYLAGEPKRIAANPK